MAEMKYLDFDLLIERSGAHYTARVLNSPAGQAAIDFSLPFSEQDIEIFLLKVGRPRRSTRHVNAPEMEAAKVFGGRLFETVFSDDVLGCFRTSLYDATQKGAGLRLRLRITNAPDLADLPWEYLYNPSLNRFLSLSVETPVVRFLSLTEAIRPLTITPPLRALVMISSPHDYPQLNVEQEWKRLAEAVDDLNRKGVVAIDRLDDATLTNLQRRLRQQEYHIFHFIGHGSFDKQANDGVLILEDEAERGRSVSGQYLGTLLHNHRPLRMAILNACEGARASRSDPFAGTAQSLVQQGIPAVIAMQFEITDVAAITFAHEFYTAVADGYPVDAAMVEARAAIFAQGNNIEWGTPVLYMRAPDGRIFDITLGGSEKTSEERVAAPELAEQIQQQEERIVWPRRHIFIASALAVSFLLIFLIFLLKPTLFKKPSPLTEKASSSISKSSDTAAISLKPIALVSIKVNPPDAEVILDEKRIELSKLSGMALSVGPHTINISRQGYKTLKEQFNLAQGDTTLRYSLQAEKTESIPTVAPSTLGEVQIDSEPTEAKIFVDDQTKGTTPSTIRNLPVGNYAIVLRKTGYKDYFTTATVVDGKVTMVRATLAPLTGKLRAQVKPSGSIYIWKTCRCAELRSAQWGKAHGGTG
ncbi:CHAT domain-containing protein [candidate division KSB1 bacterium]|nr:CHAT domain-containing protein [candidate division KSB1 bacterium]